MLKRNYVTKRMFENDLFDLALKKKKDEERIEVMRTYNKRDQNIEKEILIVKNYEELLRIGKPFLDKCEELLKKEDEQKEDEQKEDEQKEDDKEEHDKEEHDKNPVFFFNDDCPFKENKDEDGKIFQEIDNNIKKFIDIEKKKEELPEESRVLPEYINKVYIFKLVNKFIMGYDENPCGRLSFRFKINKKFKISIGVDDETNKRNILKLSECLYFSRKKNDKNILASFGVAEDEDSIGHANLAVIQPGFHMDKDGTIYNGKCYRMEPHGKANVDDIFFSKQINKCFTFLCKIFNFQYMGESKNIKYFLQTYMEKTENEQGTCLLISTFVLYCLRFSKSVILENVQDMILKSLIFIGENYEDTIKNVQYCLRGFYAFLREEIIKKYHVDIVDDSETKNEKKKEYILKCNIAHLKLKKGLLSLVLYKFDTKNNIFYENNFKESVDSTSIFEKYKMLKKNLKPSANTRLTLKEIKKPDVYNQIAMNHLIHYFTYKSRFTHKKDKEKFIIDVINNKKIQYLLLDHVLEYNNENNRTGRISFRFRVKNNDFFYPNENSAFLKQNVEKILYCFNVFNNSKELDGIYIFVDIEMIEDNKESTFILLCIDKTSINIFVLSDLKICIIFKFKGCKRMILKKRDGLDF